MNKQWKRWTQLVFTSNTQCGHGPPLRDRLAAFRAFVDAVAAAEFAVS